jgi:hypothetical protein
MEIVDNRSPRYFRKKAEEYRTQADNIEQREARSSMLRLADLYEELARRVQKLRPVQEPRK